MNLFIRIGVDACHPRVMAGLVPAIHAEKRRKHYRDAARFGSTLLSARNVAAWMAATSAAMTGNGQ
jgi:hypothetical protein